MKNLEILEAFELEINKLDDYANKPKTDDSQYWLNQAVNKFIKIRFNGDFTHKTSYEQNEKRRNDLIKLYRTQEVDFTIGSPSISTSNPQYNEYSVRYNGDFLYALNEDVDICDMQNSNPRQVSVFECTSDSFMYRVDNSLTDFHYSYGYARPLRVRTGDGCYLLTDKKYKIKKYILGYLKKPEEINFLRMDDEYYDFDNNTMYEIIKMAAQMYLENTKDERYKTLSQEVMTQE